MAKIICTKDEYEEIIKILNQNPKTANKLGVMYQIVKESPTIPENYVYDTETVDFLVYRHKYTGQEIHIIKDPEVYMLSDQPRTLENIMGVML